MILIAVVVLALVWIVVLSVTVGLCVSASQGDRALIRPASGRRAAAHETGPLAHLRLIA
jgi:hypothetical protein